MRRERISLPPYHNVNAAITWQVGMELLCALSGEAGNAIAYYRELTESRIKDFYQAALASLERLNRPPERKEELFHFASYLMNRQK